MKQIVKKILPVFAIILMQACSHQPTARLPAVMMNASALPAADPGLDHYIAWVPTEVAQTATVAEAMVHISLQHARDEVREEMCAGQPIARGVVVEKHGPVAVRTPVGMGATPAWYYRISQHPGLQGCDAASANSLYRALQSRLPAWISITPGRPVISHTAVLGINH